MRSSLSRPRDASRLLILGLEALCKHTLDTIVLVPLIVGGNFLCGGEILSGADSHIVVSLKVALGTEVGQEMGEVGEARGVRADKADEGNSRTARGLGVVGWVLGARGLAAGLDNGRLLNLDRLELLGLGCFEDFDRHDIVGLVGCNGGHVLFRVSICSP